MKVLNILIDDAPLWLMPSQYTPNINRLMAAGDRWSRFVASPNCSNDRAKVETGRYSIRPENLVGTIFRKGTVGSLEGPWMLANVLRSWGLTCAQAGKWHLCEMNNLSARFDAGFHVFNGSQANLNGESYYDWLTVENGVGHQVTEYATDYVVDLATEFVDGGYDYVELSLNAVHTPIEAPPGGSATVESMMAYADSALGRVLEAAFREGYAIFLHSDNGGTAGDGGKGNLSHQALATLLVTAGFAGVRDTGSVVDTTDIYATILDLLGVPDQGDGISLDEERDIAFADRWGKVLEPPGPGWEEMATDGVLKVIRKPATGEVTIADWYDAPSSEDVSHLLDALDNR